MVAAGGETRRADLRLRRAQLADGPALLRLVDALAEYERLAPPDAAARARLLRDAFHDPPRIEVHLAELDGTAVGYALSFETYSSFLALPTLFLEDLFVLPEHRGRGIGRALFLLLAEDARRRGCGRMEWSVLTWNEPALGFYDRLGARRMEEWVTYRLTAAELERLASSG
ncbi:MAG: N-acetyltransferase family protein [Gemmatimonadota bacterium]